MEVYIVSPKLRLCRVLFIFLLSSFDPPSALVLFCLHVYPMEHQWACHFPDFLHLKVALIQQLNEQSQRVDPWEGLSHQNCSNSRTE